MNLYLRLLKMMLLALFTGPRLGAFDESRIRFRCWPSDLDLNRHMNNGRYLTLMDLGRMDLTLRSGLIRAMLQKRWNPVAGGVTIRYRRPIRPFEKFEVRTRLLGWDEKWFYMEQRLMGQEGKLASVALIRALFVGPAGTVPPGEVGKAMGNDGPSPGLPESVLAWKKSEELLA